MAQEASLPSPFERLAFELNGKILIRNQHVSNEERIFYDTKRHTE